MNRIGVDSNVLVRLLVADDPVQSERARRFVEDLAEDQTIVVSRLVVLELFWVLRSRYRLSTVEVLDLLEHFRRQPNVEIEEATLVADAMALARQGADFADALIAVSNQRNGCSYTVTFDRHAARTIPFMHLLT